MSFSRAIACALVFSASVSAVAQCRSDTKLSAAGWVIHPSVEFQELAAYQRAQMKTHAEDFVFDPEGRWSASPTPRSLRARSWDRLSTPQAEMYGDLFVIEDLNTGEPVEVRWYDGRKHVVYDSKVEECACGDFLPMAVNALF